ncbi:MAG: hypothetical protein QOC82_190 [Frankiaceae bacterium]|nr:hypothetical protein [Frankiaceae bacterium]
MTPRPGAEAMTVVDRLARLGLAARGLVYLLIAWTAVRIASAGSGSGGGEADRKGAMATFAHNTPGKIVLVVMALGFAGYAIWRLTEVVWGHRDDDGAARWVKRGGSLCRAVLYGVFAWSAMRAAVQGESGQGSNSTSKQTTAGLLGHSGGRVAVILLGAGFIIAGIALAARGVLRKFERKLRTKDMGKRTEAVVAVLGVGGQTARGVVFAVVGGFFVDAAIRYDPQKAQGLDGALRSLARAPLGAAMLAIVAVGLAAFGAYSLAESRWRET